MLNFEKIRIPCDVIEKESSIPDVKNPKSSPFFICDESVDEQEAKNIGCGMIHTILPYKMQNNYGKRQTEREFTSAVLENESLRAVFLPELGGRLWSLYDKRYKKHLIYENGSVNIANLALCNAWFAGGVEWNVGMKGHTPFTCRPLFTKKRVGKKGNDILCMYEYEQIRGVVYSVEFTLCDAELLVRVNIKNISNADTYIYWWSNIAINEAGNRVYIPTDKTYVTSYRDGGYKISKAPVTIEMSYPRHTKEAKDYFYDIPRETGKWIACLDGCGVGLLHASSENLIGRKTFLWGTGRGGEHWNERLCNKGNYIEIQAGLAKTQFEHLPLPKGREISFVENYSLVDIGSLSYEESVKKLSDIAESKSLCECWFETREDHAPVIFGSPRGYLAELLRGRVLVSGLEFPKESLTPEFSYYHSLILGKDSYGDESTAFTRELAYKDLILKKAKITEFDYYILSVIEYANGNFEKSVEMINKSLEIRPRAYSLCMASLLNSCILGDDERAWELAREACVISPDDFATVCLYAEMSTAAKKYEDFLSFYRSASETIKGEGRVRMFVGKCLVMLNRIEEAEQFINKELSLPDIREGEYSTTNIWVEMYRRKIANECGEPIESITSDRVLAEYPIPYEIDFRMH